MKKEYNEKQFLKWSIVKSVLPYSNILKICLVSLRKKLKIVNFKGIDHLLNRLSDLISKCRHANHCLLRKKKSNN